VYRSMSMPQYIEIAVVASSSEALQSVTKGARISEPGIAPKYFLVALDKPTGKRVIGLSELKHEHILLWVALDNSARHKCDELHQQNVGNKNYSRGFYDAHLPEPVVRVESNAEFKKKVAAIYDAFCATS
jgi:hypothetical protein